MSLRICLVYRASSRTDKAVRYWNPVLKQSLLGSASTWRTFRHSPVLLMLMIVPHRGNSIHLQEISLLLLIDTKEFKQTELLIFSLAFLSHHPSSYCNCVFLSNYHQTNYEMIKLNSSFVLIFLWSLSHQTDLLMH